MNPPHLALPPDGSPSKHGQPPPHYIPPYIQQDVPQGFTFGTATTLSSTDVASAANSSLSQRQDVPLRVSSLRPHVSSVDTFDMVHTVVPLPHAPPENAPIEYKMDFLHRQLDEIGMDHAILNGLVLLGGGGHQRLQGGAYRISKHARSIEEISNCGSSRVREISWYTVSALLLDDSVASAVFTPKADLIMRRIIRCTACMLQRDRSVVPILQGKRSCRWRGVSTMLWSTPSSSMCRVLLSRQKKASIPNAPQRRQQGWRSFYLRYSTLGGLQPTMSNRLYTSCHLLLLQVDMCYECCATVMSPAQQK